MIERLKQSDKINFIDFCQSYCLNSITIDNLFRNCLSSICLIYKEKDILGIVGVIKAEVFFLVKDDSWRIYNQLMKALLWKKDKDLQLWCIKNSILYRIALNHKFHYIKEYKNQILLKR